MGCCDLVRAIAVRFIFACHGLIAIWRLNIVVKDSRYWYLTLTLGGLFVETLVTLCKKRGREWKCVVPAIWFLELNELNKRINRYNSSSEHLNNESVEGLHASFETLGRKFDINIPLHLSSDQWIKTIEQVLLLCLIVGRWILPKGKLTHDQLSQLLLVYIGTAADIVEFFDAFKEEKVRYERLLCIIILSIWSWSLLQFTMVLTATRARKDQSGLFTKFNMQSKHTCCTPDVFGIVISIFMQDAPFLVLRLLLIFHYDVVSYTNMFFTSKNTLVIVLLIYRLIVVQCTIHKEVKKHKQENKIIQESSSRQRLLVHSDSSGGAFSPNGYKYYAADNGLSNAYTYDELRAMSRNKHKRSRDRNRPQSTTINTAGLPFHPSPRPEFRPRTDKSLTPSLRHSTGEMFETPFSTPMVNRHDEFHTPAASPQVEMRGHKMWDPVVDRCPKILPKFDEMETSPTQHPAITHSPKSKSAQERKDIKSAKSCDTLKEPKVKVHKKK